MNNRSAVIVALDFPTRAEVVTVAEQLDPQQCRVKVGFEAFLNGGPSLLEDLHELGHDVFLDLKFHDIPNTVASACAAAASQGVWMLNVHASGGERMLLAAREAIDRQDHQPHLIAVTILTSTSETEHLALGHQNSIQEQVQHVALTAHKAGANGVVCSAQETAVLRGDLGEDFILVTPGIRPAGTAAQDQRRVVTPAQAIENGSHYLVIGRPITQATDPMAVLEQINVTIYRA